MIKKLVRIATLTGSTLGILPKIVLAQVATPAGTATPPAQLPAAGTLTPTVVFVTLGLIFAFLAAVKFFHYFKEPQ